jgi:hypothetical protein
MDSRNCVKFQSPFQSLISSTFHVAGGDFQRSPG